MSSESSLRHAGRAKGVGLDQIRAGGEVLFVDFANHFGAGEQQQFIIALHIHMMLGKACAAIVRFGRL